MRTQEELHSLSVGASQRSVNWHINRMKAANGSQYATMLNVYGDRDLALYRAKNGIITAPTFKMRWGTMMEDVSGFVFQHYTGLKYQELGSIPHEDYPFIRGSVDGYGVQDGKYWVLETKSPATRMPKSYVDTDTYKYQMLHNVEILDAEFALFNNVGLKVMTTENIMASIDERPKVYATNICGGYQEECVLNRFNLADTHDVPQALAVLCDVKYVGSSKSTSPLEVMHSPESEQDSKSAQYVHTIREIEQHGFNMGDLYSYNAIDGERKKYGDVLRQDSLFASFIMSGNYIVKPKQIITNMAQLEGFTQASEGSYIVLAVDGINIEKVNRDRELFNSFLLPICQKWMEDLES